MFSRLIDRFHRPAECSTACYETERIAQELRALVDSIHTNETPEQIKARFQDDHRTQGYRAPCVHQPPQTRLERTVKSCPGTEKLSFPCDCSKRNGLQDDCAKSCCRQEKRMANQLCKDPR